MLPHRLSTAVIQDEPSYGTYARRLMSQNGNEATFLLLQLLIIANLALVVALPDPTEMGSVVSRPAHAVALHRHPQRRITVCLP